MRKIRLIIDSDTANEIDDSFALAYAGACQDIFDIKAITIAPFSVAYKRINIKDGLVESKLEANRILRLVGFRNLDMVFKGADDFFENAKGRYEGVDKIISEAKRGRLMVVGLGALTNIALALKTCPEIAENLNIIWLGTKHLLYDKFDDTNYKTDKKAFEFVVKSKVKLTIIPNYIGKFIQTSENNVKHTVAVNDIGRFLYKIMRGSQFTTTSMGVRTIYDIAPIGYLVNPNWFCMKEIPANVLLKEFKKTIPSRMINYVFDMKPNAFVWSDFVNRLEGLGNKITRRKCFFISDTHFGDGRKYKLKQTEFASVDELNQEVEKRWNSVVSDKDLVYHLGDFGDYNMVKKLRGEITLICGNYEREDIKKMGFENFKSKLLSLGFHDVKFNGTWLGAEVFGTPVFMTHKPSNCKQNALNLFGHVHSLKPIMQNGINVAMIYHDYTPVDESTLQKAFNFIKSDNADKDVFM